MRNDEVLRELCSIRNFLETNQFKNFGLEGRLSRLEHKLEYMYSNTYIQDLTHRIVVLEKKLKGMAAGLQEIGKLCSE